MCARRFLMAVFVLTLLVVAAGFAIYQWGGDVLLKQAMPKGHFEAAKAGGGPDYAQASSWIARPGMADDPSHWLPDGVPRHGSQASRGLLHPPDHLSRARPLERAARCRRRHRVPDPPVRPEPGERVQRRRQDLGAALSPGGLRRVPARRARTRRRRSTSPIATSPRRSTQFLQGGRRPADHPRRAQPGRAAPRCGCCARRSPASRSRAGWSRLMSSAGRSASPPTCPRSACPPALRPIRPAASCRWRASASPPIPDLILDAWEEAQGLDRRRARSARTCCASTRSPARKDGAAPPPANPGTLVPTADLRSATLRAGPGRRALRQGPADPRRRRSRRSGPIVLPGNNYHVYDYALFWGAIRARRGAEAGGMAALITDRAAEFAAALPDGGKLAGLDVGTKTIGLAICDAGWHFAGPAETHPPDQVHQRPRSAARVRRARARSSAWSSACRSTWTAATARAPSRSAPSPATSRRSACRSCCGTSAGRPRRSSGR